MLCPLSEALIGGFLTFSQMNYAVVVLMFVLVVATAYWFIHGRKFYIGPRTHAHLEHGEIVEDTGKVINDQEKAL